MAGRFLRFSLEPSTWSASRSFERGPQLELIGAFRLAGLGNAWADNAPNEVPESYTMWTINADAHPFMNGMHKPDPKVGPAAQDQRSVKPIEAGDVDAWLAGTMEQAHALRGLTRVGVFAAGPAARGRHADFRARHPGRPAVG